MIIDDEKIGAALDYLNEFPHPAARARKELRMAEIQRDRLFAKLFLEAEGNVKERESKVNIEGLYLAACQTVADFEEMVELHKARTKGAEMIIEVWRSEQANARTAERVR